MFAKPLLSFIIEFCADRKVLFFFFLLVAMAAGCQNNRCIQFGVVADVQYGDKDTYGSRHYRIAIEKLRECVDELNKGDLEFVIQLGDIVEGGENAAKELDDVLGVFNRFRADKYHVAGNHDFFGIARPVVLSKLGLERAYYDFTVGRWRFVVLDTMDIAVSGGWPQDSLNYRQGQKMLKELTDGKAPNAVNWSGGIGAEQTGWLDDTLKDAQNRRQNVVVFGHIPLVPQGEPHVLWNNRQILDVLEAYSCVRAYICGHRHSGGYEYGNGIHHITIEGLVEAPQQNAYAVVKLCNKSIEIQGSGACAERVLKINGQ